MRACLACQGGYQGGDVLGQLVRRGPYAWDSGSERDLELVDLGEAIDLGGWLPEGLSWFYRLPVISPLFNPLSW